jgi:hypothetical protein
MACLVDELSHDVLHNRIIITTLHRLASTAEIDPHLCHELRTLERQLDDVSLLTLEQAFKQRYPDAANLRLNKQQVTELIHLHDLRVLRNAVEKYLKLKEDVWILFDNLDKGWATHGVAPEDLLIVRCLLDAARKIEQSMRSRQVECHTVIFIRNDVYLLLVEATPDRGKEVRVSLDWSEADLLRQMLRRRFIYNGLPQDADFEQLWRTICVALIDGEETSEYLIERSHSSRRDCSPMNA